MVLISWFMGFAVFAGLALLFGFIANFAFKRSSPARRALYAAATLGVLITIPAYAALIDEGAEIVSIVGVAVATAILSAVAFPLALVMTRRKPAQPDYSVFD
ncbi:bacteriorhodopsin [Porphyrobacter sp. MBR-155]|jgi:bacteriorhodopsin|uniref:hypothetical protein n=1 Tax=Porphyrobacter sp. MBR-155 TaxID=3156464 RepID=UPI003395776F